MKLAEAVICISCDEVFSREEFKAHGQSCPACGCATVVFLAKWVTPLEAPHQ